LIRPELDHRAMALFFGGTIDKTLLEYPQNTVPSKTCNTPYISETALRSVKLNRKILPPQHIVVNLFSDYPVPGKEYLHHPSPQRQQNHARLADQSYT